MCVNYQLSIVNYQLSLFQYVKEHRDFCFAVTILVQTERRAKLV